MKYNGDMDEKYAKNLTPEQYKICHLKGTEPPGSGKYNKHFETGMYVCAACKTPLFASDAKFDSGTGWPSFFDALKTAKKPNVELKPDESHSMFRTEVTCKTCGSHLGHVFPDGPAPTGKRYCINSLSLDFKPLKLSSDA